MSRQLSIASTFSVLALSALALTVAGRDLAEPAQHSGATIEFAAPALSILLPLAD